MERPREKFEKEVTKYIRLLNEFEERTGQSGSRRDRSPVMPNLEAKSSIAIVKNLQR